MFDESSILKGAGAALDILTFARKQATLWALAILTALLWAYLLIDDWSLFAHFSHIAPLGSVVLFIIAQRRMRLIVSSLAPRVEALTRVEELPGLLAFHPFFIIAERLRAISIRQGHSLAVLTLNIEHYRDLRKIHGGEASQQILNRFSEIILQTIRMDSDVVCQIRDAEFAVLLIDCDIDCLNRVVARLQKSFERESFKDILITIRLGAAIVARSDTSIYSVIGRAEFRQLRLPQPR